MTNEALAYKGKYESSLRKSAAELAEASDSQARLINARFHEMLNTRDRMLKRITRMFCRFSHDQHDLYQEIVYRLWSNFRSFRGESSETTWIYAIALSTARLRYRARSRKPETLGEVPEKFHPMVTVEESDADKIIEMDRLNDMDKSILLLLMDGYKFQEVANILEVEPNVMRQRVYRLRERLKK